MKDRGRLNVSVLYVEDEDNTREAMSIWLRKEVDTLFVATDGFEGVELFKRNRPQIVITDLRMPRLDGMSMARAMRNMDEKVQIIVLTAYDQAKNLLEAIDIGINQFVTKPVEMEKVQRAIHRCMEVLAVERQKSHIEELNSELAALRKSLSTDPLSHPDEFAAIKTCSTSMVSVFKYVEAVAPTNQPVLITGETGVGKELLARAVHAISKVQGGFVAINVAGLDDAMFSDTLFGHRKGAFTGADQQRDGLIAKAAKGTLFLDEIGDLNELSQIKLLRLLQEQEYYPVGSDQQKSSDARIVMATNRDLKRLIDEGRFRKDLYYRLCAHQVHIPPLRERSEDLRLLIDHFAEEAATVFRKKKPEVSLDVHTCIANLPFPGNVRELKAMIYDAIARCPGSTLHLEQFSIDSGHLERYHLRLAIPPDFTTHPLIALFGHFPSIDEMETYLIVEAMKLANDNQKVAASFLGIARQTLSKHLKSSMLPLSKQGQDEAPLGNC